MYITYLGLTLIKLDVIFFYYYYFSVYKIFVFLTVLDYCVPCGKSGALTC